MQALILISSSNNNSKTKTNLYDFIKANGYEISKLCMTYITGLTQGEDYPSYVTGFPRYANLKCKTIKKKLKKFNL